MDPPPVKRWKLLKLWIQIKWKKCVKRNKSSSGSSSRSVAMDYDAIILGEPTFDAMYVLRYVYSY